jgi:hypothetical protein
MFSGYLMAAVYNLEGKGGFRGWQVSFGACVFVSVAMI